MAVGIVDQHCSILSLEDEQAARGGPYDSVPSNQFAHVIQGAGATQNSQRKGRRSTNLLHEIEIITFHSTVPVYGVKNDFACAQCLNLLRESRRIQTGFACRIQRNQFRTPQ